MVWIAFSGKTTDTVALEAHETRAKRLPTEKRDPVPQVALAVEEHTKNNLPNMVARWRSQGYGVPASAGWASKSSNASDNAHPSPAKAGTPNGELVRPRTAQRIYIPKAEFAAQGCDLSLNRYKDVVHAELKHCSSGEILASLTD